MATAERASEIEPLSCQLMELWHHISDFELYRMLRKLDALLKVANLQETILLHNLAGVGLGRLQHYPQALERLQAGLTLARQQNLLAMQVVFLGNIGNVYASMNQHEKAMEVLLQATDLLGEEAWKDVRLLAALSDVLWTLNRTEDATAIFEKARDALHMDSEEELFSMATCAATCERYDLAVHWLGRMLSIRFGGTGSDLEKILRARDVLVLSPAMFHAIEYALGREEQRSIIENAPSTGSAEVEALKQEILAAWAPVRHRATASVAR